MSDLNLAVIADIHGNRWALEAVLDNLALWGVERIVNLGDSLYGPLDPAGTAEILIDRRIPTVRGNEDRIIVEPTAGDRREPTAGSGREPIAGSGLEPTLDFVRRSLEDAHLDWIASLDETMVVDGRVLLCHGTPWRDDAYLLEEVIDSGVRARTAAELVAMLARLEPKAVLCGHSHRPGTVYLPEGRVVANPGSVGLQAYTDDNPRPHAIENRTPHARYCKVLSNEEGIWIENFAVPYDWEAAALTALANNRPDWAEWLRTGCSTPDRGLAPTNSTV